MIEKYKSRLDIKEKRYRKDVRSRPWSKLIDGEEKFCKMLEKDSIIHARDDLMKKIAKTRIKEPSVVNAIIQKKIPGAPEVTEAQIEFYRKKYGVESESSGNQYQSLENKGQYDYNKNKSSQVENLSMRINNDDYEDR